MILCQLAVYYGLVPQLFHSKHDIVYTEWKATARGWHNNKQMLWCSKAVKEENKLFLGCSKRRGYPKTKKIDGDIIILNLWQTKGITSTEQKIVSTTISIHNSHFTTTLMNDWNLRYKWNRHLDDDSQLVGIRSLFSLSLYTGTAVPYKNTGLLRLLFSIFDLVIVK